MTVRTFFEAMYRDEKTRFEKNDEKALKELFNTKIANGDYKIDLPYEKINSLSYLAHASGHDNLLSLIEKATMDKDFTIRNKAKNQLMQKMQPCYKWLKENLKNIISNEKLFIKGDNENTIFFEYKSFDLKKPYIKFILKNQKLRLISFHDSKYSNSAKSYNDKSSYKVGKKDNMSKIKQRIKNINFGY